MTKQIKKHRIPATGIISHRNVPVTEKSIVRNYFTEQ